MFSFKASDSKKLSELYGKRMVEDVSRRALTETARKTRTEISKQVRKVFNVSAGKVREKSYVYRQRGRVSHVDIGYRDFRPNLGRFSTSAQKSVRVKINKKRGTKVVKGGFRIAKFGSLIWKRLTPQEAASSRYRGRRVKIKVLRTISVGLIIILEDVWA